LASGGADVEEKPGKDYHRRRHRSFWNARLELNNYSDKNVSKFLFETFSFSCDF
jgi:hypothetical protein